MDVVERVYRSIHRKKIRDPLDFCRAVYLSLPEDELRETARRHGLAYHGRDDVVRELVFRAFRSSPVEPVLGRRPSPYAVATFTTASTPVESLHKIYDSAYLAFSRPGLRKNLAVLSDFMNGLSVIDVYLFFSYAKNSMSHVNLYLLEGLTLESFYGWCRALRSRISPYGRDFNVLLVPFLCCLLNQKNAIAWSAVDTSVFRPYLDRLLTQETSVAMKDLVSFANKWLNEQCLRERFTLLEIRHLLEIMATELEDLCRRSPPLPAELIIYRGVKKNYLDTFGYTENRKRYTYNPCFSSGSLSRAYALTYAGKDCCLLEITVPAGSRVLLLRAATFDRHEHEVVLPSNTRFEVVSKKTENGRQVYVLRYLA